jgi:hypothetical protein
MECNGGGAGTTPCVLSGLAVRVADGRDCLADLRAVRDQEPSFGTVASKATASRIARSVGGVQAHQELAA